MYVYMTEDDSATAKRETGHLSTAPERRERPPSTWKVKAVQKLGNEEGQLMLSQ